MRHLRNLALLVGAFLAAPCAAEVQPAGFPLKEGDIWVMAGDSITAQHQHSNYFEAFCFARYPKMKFAFRNSGVGGHTIPSTLARFEYDIAAWKPTIVSVELGMNDSGSTATDQFVKNMGTIVERIRKSGARPVILAASPVNDGTTTMRPAGRNIRLAEYATALKGFCAKEQIPYADQFHALVDVWGANKTRENIASLKPLAADDTLAGVEHLRAFLAAQEKSPAKSVSMQGDPVHPGPPGQLMMAAALLKRLGAEGFVSSVTLDAEGKVVESKGCKIDGAKGDAGRLEFDRTDETAPFPIPDDARQVLPLAPEVFEMSQYLLKVTGLKDGSYLLKIDGVACGKHSAKDLAAGINLTGLSADLKAKDVNPIVAQSRRILMAVAAKEVVVGQWRGLSQKVHAPKAAPELKEQLDALTKKVEEADVKIREAAAAKKMHFELTPAQ